MTNRRWTVALVVCSLLAAVLGFAGGRQTAPDTIPANQPFGTVSWLKLGYEDSGFTHVRTLYLEPDPSFKGDIEQMQFLIQENAFLTHQPVPEHGYTVRVEADEFGRLTAILPQPEPGEELPTFSPHTLGINGGYVPITLELPEGASLEDVIDTNLIWLIPEGEAGYIDSTLLETALRTTPAGESIIIGSLSVSPVPDADHDVKIKKVNGQFIVCLPQTAVIGNPPVNSVFDRPVVIDHNPDC